MINVRFDPKLSSTTQRFTHELVSAVLEGCDPGKLLREHTDLKAFNRRTHILAFGKASLAMATECAKLLGTRCGGGVVLAPEQLIRDQRHDLLDLYPVDHPLPTLRNIQATHALVDYARSIPSSDQCIVCISGGGSAHLCSPAPGYTLDQIIETTRALNARGDDIHTLNESRRAMDSLKGGGLARILDHVDHCEAIVLSDVLGNNLETIASGPMLFPQSNIQHQLIGDHLTALESAAAFFEQRDFRVPSMDGNVHGFAADVGRDLARGYKSDSDAANTDHQVHLIAGETTVPAKGAAGVGGPALEVVLNTAFELCHSSRILNDWLVIGIATDGMDGPSEAAGAVLSRSMLSDPDCRRRGSKALQDHDTLPFLGSLGSVFWTGPTGTNLNDVYVVCGFDAD